MPVAPLSDKGTVGGGPKIGSVLIAVSVRGESDETLGSDPKIGSATVGIAGTAADGVAWSDAKIGSAGDSGTAPSWPEGAAGSGAVGSGATVAGADVGASALGATGVGVVATEGVVSDDRLVTTL